LRDIEPDITSAMNDAAWKIIRAGIRRHEEMR
jgi:hypothetical protein